MRIYTPVARRTKNQQQWTYTERPQLMLCWKKIRKGS